MDGRARRAGQWLSARIPEFLLILLGVALRVSMRWRFNLTRGYDGPEHWRYVDWIVQHRSLPRADALIEAFHPPLFYAVAAWLTSHGVSPRGVLWVPISAGIVRLLLGWICLEWYIGSRSARLGALALAAVLPVSVHIDGMLYPEPLSGMFAMGAILLIPRAFQRVGRSRLAYTTAIGILLALELLTKISALVIVAAVGLVAVLESALAPGIRARDRLQRLLPWAMIVVVPALLTGWYFRRNVRDVGQPFPTSFDLSTQYGVVSDLLAVPYRKRRSLDFFIGWEPRIYEFPYYPTGLKPHPHFFPVLVASTFVDYWNFSFSGIDPAQRSGLSANRRPLTPRLLAFSRGSVIGGTLIALASTIAFVASLVRALGRRNFGHLSPLVITMVTVASGLHFAIKYPRDDFGVIKASYLLFGCAPLLAMFGLAVAWATKSRLRQPLLVVLLGALGAVAAYTLYCRFPSRM